jgi:hypothetical protein
MKRFIIICTLLLTSTSFAFAQNEENGVSRPCISYDELQEWSRKKNGQYDAYISKDGHKYHREDKLTFGVTSDGKTYRYMWERENAMHFLANVPTLPISGKWAGKTGVIKHIFIRGNKKKGHDVLVILAVGGLRSRIEVRPFEMALESGEIVSKGFTKDSALKALKEAKDMLDLGLITNEQYEVKKAELSKYIIGK